MGQLSMLWQFDYYPKDEAYAVKLRVSNSLKNFIKEFKFSPTLIEISPQHYKNVFNEAKTFEGIALSPSKDVFTNQVRFCFDRVMKELIDERRKERNVPS